IGYWPGTCWAWLTGRHSVHIHAARDRRRSGGHRHNARARRDRDGEDDEQRYQHADNRSEHAHRLTLAYPRFKRSTAFPTLTAVGCRGSTGKALSRIARALLLTL